jgi:hypothetical protein
MRKKKIFIMTNERSKDDNSENLLPDEPCEVIEKLGIGFSKLNNKFVNLLEENQKIKRQFENLQEEYQETLRINSELNEKNQNILLINRELNLINTELNEKIKKFYV